MRTIQFGKLNWLINFSFHDSNFFWFIDIVFRFSIWCNDYKIGIFAKYFGCFVQQSYMETLGKFHNWSLTTSKCTSIFQIHFWNSPSQDCEFQTCKALNPSGREPKLVPTVPWSISASASSLAKSSLSSLSLTSVKSSKSRDWGLPEGRFLKFETARCFSQVDHYVQKMMENQGIYLSELFNWDILL